jgi:hypothetical protein
MICRGRWIGKEEDAERKRWIKWRGRKRKTIRGCGRGIRR